MMSFTGDGSTAFKNVYIDGERKDPKGRIIPDVVARGEFDPMENAYLIAFARNCWPEILALYEAAEKINSDHGQCDDTCEKSSCAFMRYREAREALDDKAREVSK